MIGRLQLAEIIAKKTLVPNVSIAQLSQEVAAYLLDNKLTAQLDSILRDISMYRYKVGILDVKVISAYQLSSDNLSNIRELINQYFDKIKSIVIEPIIDTNIIGGVKLEFPAQSLDLTVKAKLDRLIRLTNKERL